MKVRAGSLPPTQIHRVNTLDLEQDEGVTVTPRKYADRPMPYEFAGEDEDGPMESLAFAIVMVIAIGSISIWMFV